MDCILECGKNLQQPRKFFIFLEYWGELSKLAQSKEDTRSAFINTRCRLQRLKDAKFFAGWVVDLTEEVLQLRLSTKTTLEESDNFNIEIHGTDRSAVFQAALITQDGDNLVFAVPQTIRFMPAREKARLAVRGVTGICTYQGLETAFDVSDVSLEGIGIVLPVGVLRGAHLELEIQSPHGPIQCNGHVRYCRTDPDVAGWFRIGILLDDMGRLETARWARLFEYYAAA